MTLTANIPHAAAAIHQIVGEKARRFMDEPPDS
jgi:hypothetical protein